MQYEISTVRAYIDRSTGRSTTPVEGNFLSTVGSRIAAISHFYISTVRAHIDRSTGRSTTPVEASSGQEWQFSFLLLELIFTDQLAYLLTPVEASSGQDWQFHLSTFRALILADQLADLCPHRGI